MRQAIVTRYLGPTNFRGSRVKAKAEAGAIIVPWDDALTSETNHLKAAQALADKFAWLDTFALAGGALPDNGGYCWVLVFEER